jgi:CRISPR type I-E-associated protein CasB/Cse2
MSGDREARFVEAVLDLRITRPGDAAALRRSLAMPPGADPRVHRIVYPLLHGVRPQDEWRWFLVAALATLVPRESRARGSNVETGVSLGWSLRRLAASEERGPRSRPGRRPPSERRFAALLDADAREMHVHLRGLVRRCLRAGVDVDLARLLRDLRRWSDPTREVQRRWARDFWAGQTDRGLDGQAPDPAVDETTDITDIAEEGGRR